MTGPEVPPETGGADDLLRIMGIGPRTLTGLQRLGIVTYRDLAAATPEDLAALLRKDGLGTTASTIRRYDWIGQAQRLAGRRRAAPARDGRQSEDRPVTASHHRSARPPDEGAREPDAPDVTVAIETLRLCRQALPEPRPTVEATVAFDGPHRTDAAAGAGATGFAWVRLYTRAPSGDERALVSIGGVPTTPGRRCVTHHLFACPSAGRHVLEANVRLTGVVPGDFWVARPFDVTA